MQPAHEYVHSLTPPTIGGGDQNRVSPSTTL